MDFCYVWLKQLVSADTEGFDRSSTRSSNELTGNVTQDRGLEHFTDGLSSVYRAMAQALKSGAPLAFTFHHNRIEAYHAVGVAILDAGLICSASLPCPAEMGGSIHIHGTGSSIVDTVFVCRSEGQFRRDLIFFNTEELDAIIRDDLAQLLAAGMKPTAGDFRCIAFGHLTRMAIWNLRKSWKPALPAVKRLDLFARAVVALGDPQPLIDSYTKVKRPGHASTRVLPLFGEGLPDAISF
jgi:hypothetical protein